MYKFTALAALAKDFCSVAEGSTWSLSPLGISISLYMGGLVYGRVIISERFLPYKTIEPSKNDNYVYVAHGLNFKIFLDEVIGQDEEGVTLSNILSLLHF